MSEPLIVRYVIVAEGERAHPLDECLAVIHADPEDTRRALMSDVDRLKYRLVEQLDTQFGKRVDT